VQHCYYTINRHAEGGCAGGISVGRGDFLRLGRVLVSSWDNKKNMFIKMFCGV
jgi:hypothetical protein